MTDIFFFSNVKYYGNQQPNSIGRSKCFIEGFSLSNTGCTGFKMLKEVFVSSSD